MGKPGRPELTGLAPSRSQESHGPAGELSVGRLHCSQGSRLRLAGCGPEVITHSGRPLLLCPFRLLPEIQAVPKTPEQPVSCELRGQAGARNQDELGQARSTQRVRFRSEAENDHHEGAGLKVKTKTSHPRGILRKSPSSTEDSASSSRAESSQSTQTKGRPSRLAFVAKDSFKLHKERMRRAQEEREEETTDRPSRPPLLSQDSFKLNKERMRRAKDEQEEEIKGRPSRRPFLAQDSFRLNKERMRRAQDEREEPAASTSHDDSSRSEGSSIDRSGWLPPIN